MKPFVSVQDRQDSPAARRGSAAVEADQKDPSAADSVPAQASAQAKGSAMAYLA